MKLLIQSAMIFFGTLMAAGLVALGEPSGASLAVASPPMQTAQTSNAMVAAATQPAAIDASKRGR